MEIDYGKTGPERKKLVKAIEEITRAKATYAGVPSCAYRVLDYQISKDGVLSWPDDTNNGNQDLLISRLEEAGFISRNQRHAEKNEIDNEKTGLTISIPLDKVNEENLKSLLEAKGNLLMKALGITDLSFVTDEEKVSFPWFKIAEESEISTYTRLIQAICEMSKNQKRIIAKPKENENEKYAFRCFLLRLGFIGDAYKADRKLLLSKLDGSSAFKNGQKGGNQ